MKEFKEMTYIIRNTIIRENMSIFESYKQYKNRFVMAPMTRGRSNELHLATEIMEIYYKERSSAGLIITEGVHISEKACGWMNVPGIYNKDQIESWKSVTNAVHTEGGKIFMQLWHQGRTSHSDFGNGQPFAPSAIKASGEVHGPKGKVPYEMPVEMTKYDMEQTKNDFVKAAKNAIEAGFDGVEIHGANGYLLDEFTRSTSNNRSDEYGGNPENRIRYPVEVTKAICDAIGSERVGYRISPLGKYNDMKDETPNITFGLLASKLNELNIQYIHLMEPTQNHPMGGHPGNTIPMIRSSFKNTLILNGGLDNKSGQKHIDDCNADMIAIGVPFIANPDLIHRYKNNLELNFPDFSKLYTNSKEGYIDYPHCI